MCELDSSMSGYGSVAGSCVHVNETQAPWKAENALPSRATNSFNRMQLTQWDRDVKRLRKATECSYRTQQWLGSSGRTQRWGCGPWWYLSNTSQRRIRAEVWLHAFLNGGERSTWSFLARQLYPRGKNLGRPNTEQVIGVCPAGNRTTVVQPVA